MTPPTSVDELLALLARGAEVYDEPDVDAFAWAPGGGQIAVRTAHDGQWRLYIVQP